MHSVKEYWIVDPNNKSIEIFTLVNQQYQLHAFGVEGEKISSVVLDGLELDLPGIFLK